MHKFRILAVFYFTDVERHQDDERDGCYCLPGFFEEGDDQLDPLAHGYQQDKNHNLQKIVSLTVLLQILSSPLRLHTQLVTPNHWLVTQRMNMR